MVPVAAVVVVALVAGVVGFVVLGGDEAGAEVTLEPATSPGADPFTESMAVVEVAEFPGEVEAVITDARAELPSDNGVLTPVGTEPGLYGGTGDEAACDADLLVEFLDENPDKAAAWAEVAGIRPADIAEFLASLTPVVLTTDTWVTNHGFADGRATPRQSVLQAGTAVMVDDRGVPRVKCGCGNPLLEPTTTDVTPTSTDDAWEGYDPNHVAVVDPGDQTAIFTVRNIETGDTYRQPTGSGAALPEGVDLGAGDVQVTLQWVGDADMDLHVVDPTGTEIFYGNRTSPSGGELDVDRIPGCGSAPEPQVENVFWPTGAAPGGEYTAWVRQFAPCEGTQDYTLIVRVQDDIVINERGSITGANDSPEVTFTVDGAGGGTGIIDLSPRRSSSRSRGDESTTTATDPTRDTDGDLGIPGHPITSPACDGSFVTFVGAATDPADYRARVTTLLERYPGSEYLQAAATCPSLRGRTEGGELIHGVYLGPFPTAAEACAARAEGPADAYVKPLDNSSDPDELYDC